MTNHPLKMKDKLKAKKRPITRCQIFVGDPDKHRESTQETFLKLIQTLKDFKPDQEMPEAMRIAGKHLLEDWGKSQEEYFQTFVFRAMHPVEFERLLDEHKPRPDTEDVAYNGETFPHAVFTACLIEPVYDTLSEEEWKAFLDECSHKELTLLYQTALECNMRNIEPSTPKDLMTL